MVAGSETRFVRQCQRVRCGQTGAVWYQRLNVDGAVRAAHDLYNGPWGRIERGHCLRRLEICLSCIPRRLVRWKTDTGNAERNAVAGKIHSEYLHFYAGAADKVSGETLPIDKPDMFVFTDREPLGVIAAIAMELPAVFERCQNSNARIWRIDCRGWHSRRCGKYCHRPFKGFIGRISFSVALFHPEFGAEFCRGVLELGGKSPFIVFEDAGVRSTGASVVSSPRPGRAALPGRGSICRRLSQMSSCSG